MADGCQGFAPANDLVAHAPGAVIRHAAVGPRMAWALEQDPYTIGRWAAAFGKERSTALIFERSGGSPTLGETQQADLETAVQEQPAMSGIELANWTLRQAQGEGCVSVCLGTLRHWPEPEHLPELHAPSGIRVQAPQETAAQGGSGQAGGLRVGVRRPVGRGAAYWSSVLERRYSLPTRHTSGRTPNCGATGC